MNWPREYRLSALTVILTSYSLRPRKLDITKAQDLWRMISSAPGKVDALVETPCCGFSLEEFVTASSRKILLRTSDGRIRGSNPWNLSNGEDS
jgi:phosphoribosyl-dephospho-CoA transferase